MSLLKEGARRLVGRGQQLDARVAGLGRAVEASRGRLDDALLEPAAALVDRAGSRLKLSSQHTVVALGGATGSGKSSTFNALTDLELAAVGVRRPTTSWATACIWGTEGADELLDWLGIPQRHRVVRDSMLDTGREGKELSGLVLLDLPDHDSTETSHHVEMDRLVQMADLMVWVLDPQKYADAAIHDRYLAPMAPHQDVMLVVLNHIDEVPVDRREGMLADVRRLLVLDGLTDVPVLATSARSGDGIAELRTAIAKRVAAKAASRQRLATDVGLVAEELAAATGEASPARLGERERAELVDAVTDAAGVPLVVDAVHKAATVRARQATGWPLTKWLSRFRPDPLRRLHLDLGPRGGRDLVAAARASVPPADHVQRARVESAVRDVADHVSAPLTMPWAAAVRGASTSRMDDLSDRLDRAVVSTDLGVGRVPLWCRFVRLLQWLLFLAALVGGVWLAGLALTGYLQMPEPTTPARYGVPAPTALLVGGAALGILLALLSRVLVGVGARSRARRADRRLRAAAREVTEELVVAPVDAVLADYQVAVEGLRQARG
jgi:GTP-binding protein EngB required for normal cell division